jgi:hypothetical protein
MKDRLIHGKLVTERGNELIGLVEWVTASLLCGESGSHEMEAILQKEQIQIQIQRKGVK